MMRAFRLVCGSLVLLIEIKIKNQFYEIYHLIILNIVIKHNSVIYGDY